MIDFLANMTRTEQCSKVWQKFPPRFSPNLLVQTFLTLSLYVCSKYVRSVLSSLGLVWLGNYGLIWLDEHKLKKITDWARLGWVHHPVQLIFRRNIFFF